MIAHGGGGFRRLATSVLRFEACRHQVGSRGEKEMQVSGKGTLAHQRIQINILSQRRRHRHYTEVLFRALSLAEASPWPTKKLGITSPKTPVQPQWAACQRLAVSAP
jgi:hypothetical protein